MNFKEERTPSHRVPQRAAVRDDDLGTHSTASGKRSAPRRDNSCHHSHARERTRKMRAKILTVFWLVITAGFISIPFNIPWITAPAFLICAVIAMTLPGKDSYEHSDSHRG